MKKLYISLLGLLFCFKVGAQLPNTTCSNAIQICFDNPVGYPATVNAGAAETGPEYGCLNTRPNPAWFYFQVSTPGAHQLFITNTQNRDLDFIIYGPFSPDNPWCDSLTALNTADCSYSGGTTETANFTSTTSGAIYVLLVTNFANLPTNVSVVQNAGNGSFTCDFTAPCLVSQVLASPGSCDTLTNQYTVSGQVWSFNTPQTGSLNITLNNQSQTLQAPFSNPILFTFSGLPSNATVNNINASFSASANCSGSVSYTAPSSCIPCQATLSSNSPVCQGDNVQITCNFSSDATFQWVGPNFFTSSQQNPSFTASSDSVSGEYTVLITGENCVSERTISVDVIQSPPAQIIPLISELCEGEILFLSAVDFPGASFQWVGPNGFQANTRNTQINDASPASSGNYIVSFSVNGCTGAPDTLAAQIFAAPNINLIFPEFINPQEGPSTFYVQGSPQYTYQWNFIGNTTLIASVVFSAQNDTAYITWDGGEGLVGAQVIATDSNGCVSDPVQSFAQVQIPLGNDRIDALSQAVISPNPAESSIRIIGPVAGNYTIYDLTGKIVSVGKITGPESIVPRNDLKPGIYWVSIEQEHAFVRLKLILQ